MVDDIISRCRVRRHWLDIFIFPAVHPRHFGHYKRDWFDCLLADKIQVEKDAGGLQHIVTTGY